MEEYPRASSAAPRTLSAPKKWREKRTISVAAHNSDSDEDMDIKEVTKVYDFIHNRVTELNGNLQVIVVDHAKLDNDNFRDDIIEDWKSSDNYLIPREWYKT